MGQANEKIARLQDSYVTKASETWLESMERSLTQMKEYQVRSFHTSLYSVSDWSWHGKL